MPQMPKKMTPQEILKTHALIEEAEALGRAARTLAEALEKEPANFAKTYGASLALDIAKEAFYEHVLTVNEYRAQQDREGYEKFVMSVLTGEKA